MNVIEKIDQGLADPKTSEQTKLWLANLKGMISVQNSSDAIEEQFKEVGSILESMMNQQQALARKDADLEFRVETLEKFASEISKPKSLSPQDLPDPSMHTG